MKLAPQDKRTFFVTAGTHQRKPLFKSEPMARLFLSLLKADREKNRYAIHEYVLMPDHIHLLLTPAPEISLEKALQFVKGGFSFRAKKDLGFKEEVWQSGYNEHRITDAEDYSTHRVYIRENPMRAGLVSSPDGYPWSSVKPGFDLDPIPPGLKPEI